MENEVSTTIEVENPYKVETFILGEPTVHSGADTLCLFEIKGTSYTYVAKTDQWKDKIGTLVCWVCPDSICDLERPEFSFLKDMGAKNGRIKAKKIRGITSFGLLIPAPAGLKEGDDGMEALGIKHYNPETDPVLIKNKGLSLGPSEEESAPVGIYYKYDLLNNMKYGRSIFAENEIVSVSEKINGCLPPGAKVTLSNYSNMQIGKVVNQKMIGMELLGVNNEGKLVPSKITNIFYNGTTSIWYKIKGKRLNSGRGGNEFSLRCTEDHQFYNGKNYVRAADLKVGDKVFTLRLDASLSPLQEQVLLGKMLGDGSLRYKAGQDTAHLSFTHKADHKDYITFCNKALGSLSNNNLEEAISGFGSNMLRSRTLNSFKLFEFCKDFIKTGEKTIPDWLPQKLGPIALAFWYMDDGSLSHDKGQEDRANFATCAFSDKDCEILLKCLQKFDIFPKIQKSQNSLEGNVYNNVRLNAIDAEKFFLLIAPYIPPVMQYKLPERYRGGPGWIPSHDYRPQLVEQQIDSISMRHESSGKYDLETETHNYLANGILVHNSNFRVMFDGEKLFVGSRTQWKKEFPTAPKMTYEELLERKKGNVEATKEIWDKIQNKDYTKRSPWWTVLDACPGVVAFCKANPKYTVYGEYYGHVGGFPYGCNGKPKFAAFDILIPDVESPHYMNVREFQETCQVYSIPQVPFMGEVPYNLENLIKLSEGNTIIPGTSHIKEGIVLKKIIDTKNARIRGALKLVSATYLEKN